MHFDFYFYFVLQYRNKIQLSKLENNKIKKHKMKTKSF